MDNLREINIGSISELSAIDEEDSLADVAQRLLDEKKDKTEDKQILSVPIAELSTLGAGVASLIPALNTVTQTTTIAADGLYRLANASVGDTLKVAKNGNFWLSLIHI